MRYALLLSAFALAACQTTTTDAPADREAPRVARDSACGAEAMSSVVGQPTAVFAAMTFPANTRFIFPGMPVTLDYNPERLNFDIDGSRRITRAWCG